MTEAALLRGSTVAAAAAGVLSLGVQGQLRPMAALGALVLLLIAGAAPVVYPGGRAATLRRRVAKAIVLGGCLIGALWLLVLRAGTGIGETTGLVHQVGATVSLSLVVVLAAQLACADSRRELRVVLLASLLCGLVALGTAEGGGAQDLLSGLGFFLALGWAAALLSMWLLQRAKQRDEAAFVHLGRVMGDGRHLGALVVGSALIGLASLLLLPHPSGWHPSGLDSTRSGPGSPLQKSDNANDQAEPRSADSYLRGALDLNSRGALSHKRLVSVPADSPELWASSALYDYGGSYWARASTPGRHSSCPSTPRGAMTCVQEQSPVQRLTAPPGRTPSACSRRAPPFPCSHQGTRSQCTSTAGSSDASGGRLPRSARPQRRVDRGEGRGHRELPAYARDLSPRIARAAEGQGRGRRLPVRVTCGVLRALRVGRGRAAAFGRRARAHRHRLCLRRE